MSASQNLKVTWKNVPTRTITAENATNTGYDLWALSVSDRKPHLMLGEVFNEWAGVFSPDMRWVAYVSLETGARGVYVRPFRVSGQTGQPSFDEGKWQVSKDYGNWPQWRIDREIVFNTAPGGTDVFAAPVSGSNVNQRGAQLASVVEAAKASSRAPLSRMSWLGGRDSNSERSDFLSW